MKITSFMRLKENVVQFVRTHMHTAKMKDLKTNFEMSQSAMALENPDLEPRTWSKYWSDMLKNGEWADDTFIQACAWYTNMNIVIVSAGHATPEQPFYAMEGTFATETTGPTLLVGFINGNHYQSLLPLQEDRPEFLAKPAIDKTLHDTLQALGFAMAKLKQGSQVKSAVNPLKAAVSASSASSSKMAETASSTDPVKAQITPDGKPKSSKAAAATVNSDESTSKPGRSKVAATAGSSKDLAKHSRKR